MTDAHAPAPHAPSGATVPAEAVMALLHDLNGLLSPVVGFSDLLVAGTLPAEKHPQALQAIRGGARDVVERLKRARAELLPDR